MFATKENIDEIVKLLPCKTKGKYKGFSIILFCGTGGDYSEWDNFDLKSFYNKIKKHWCNGAKYESKFKGILNFQTKLSRITQTFSFTPLEYLLTNNFENKTKYSEIYPNEYFFDKKQIKDSLIKLLNFHDIKGPYLFIGFSEGGYRILDLQSRMKNVLGCILIDPERFSLLSPEHISMFQYIDSFTTKENKLELLWKQISYYKWYNFVSKFKLNIKVPVICYMNVENFENDYTQRFLSENEFVDKMNNKTEFKIFFDEIHALHLIHFDEIIEDVKLLSKNI